MSHHRFYESEIIDIQDETPNTKRFYFKIPHVDDFVFKGGQFVMLDMPIESKVTHRSYSIASSPSGDNIIELVIALNPPGMGTPYMWEHYKIGTKVPMSGPIGKFLLQPQSTETDVCFICTGTGIAPFRSMLGYMLKHNTAHKNLYLVFGSRKVEDLLYKKEMEDLQEKLPGFKYIPVLSREDSTTWGGKHGYVHPVYEELFADRRHAHFYICGWRNMVREARDRLANMGYTRDQIKFELYD